MKKHIQILLSTFICIGCSLLCHAAECESAESVTTTKCFFKKNPPIKLYQKTGLLFVTTTIENTSSSKIEIEYYTKNTSQGWTYETCLILGPKDKAETDSAKYPIFIPAMRVMKLRVRGYTNALYVRLEGNKIVSVWFDRDE